MRGTRPDLRALVAVVLAALVLGACGDGPSEQPSEEADSPSPEVDERETLSGTLRLYTSVTEDTVDAVVSAFREVHPEVEVETFRAPTGELTARIAAEQREGEVRADVFWLTDPLSMQPYAEEGLLRQWQPEEAQALPEELVEGSFWGTRILNLVIVHQEGLEPAPTSWWDLAERSYEQPIAMPDPGFAGSAFGALAFFALDDDHGFDFYRTLVDNGAVQVQSPGDVVTGVAEGRYAAGISLDRVARDAAEKGSPLELVAPEPGAVAIYSPIAVVASEEPRDLAEAFVDFALGVEAQEAIASTGWQPVRDEVSWPHDLPQVFPDWQTAFERRDELLETYRTIVGG